jgi:NAD(P)H-flavin reductase
VRKGYVQEALAELAPDAEGDIAYLCGNPNMVDTCFEALKGAACRSRTSAARSTSAASRRRRAVKDA